MNTKENKCENGVNCTCPNTDCENHGKCCTCIAHHRDNLGNTPNCYKK